MCQLITKNVSGFEVRTLSAQVPSTTARLDRHNTCKIGEIVTEHCTIVQLKLAIMSTLAFGIWRHPNAAKRIKMLCIELLSSNIYYNISNVSLSAFHCEQSPVTSHSPNPAHHQIRSESSYGIQCFPGLVLICFGTRNELSDGF